MPTEYVFCATDSVLNHQHGRSLTHTIIITRYQGRESEHLLRQKARLANMKQILLAKPPAQETLLVWDLGLNHADLQTLFIPSQERLAMIFVECF